MRLLREFGYWITLLLAIPVIHFVVNRYELIDFKTWIGMHPRTFEWKYFYATAIHSSWFHVIVIVLLLIPLCVLSLVRKLVVLKSWSLLIYTPTLLFFWVVAPSGQYYFGALCLVFGLSSFLFFNALINLKVIDALISGAIIGIAFYLPEFDSKMGDISIFPDVVNLIVGAIFAFGIRNSPTFKSIWIWAEKD